MATIFNIFIFPGFLFVCAFALFAEFLDRKIYARLQSRIGPPWFQPLADFIKLLGKEDTIPKDANPRMFRLMPVVALSSAVTSFLYIPLWTGSSLYPFAGDIIVVLYFLTIPTFTFFIGGWYSTSLYARLGAVRTITQLFAYEVPLFMGILAPALLADTWSLGDISKFYSAHPWLWLCNIIGFVVSLIALLGKLEKAPFDIPEAETEIVAGSFTEYSGRLFAFFKLTLNVEMVAGASLLAAVFLPFHPAVHPVLAFIVFILKVLLIITLLSVARTVVARLRIDQMISFCWNYLAPLALAQILLNLVIKGMVR